MNKLWDFNPTIGGPIVQDKLWFYGGFRFSGAQNYIASMFTEPAPDRAAVLPACRRAAPTVDAFHPARWSRIRRISTNQAVGGDTWTRGETLNLTWQATPKNKITTYGHFNQRLVDCNQCSATTSPEAGVYFTHRPGVSCRRRGTTRCTNKLLFEGGFTFYNERWIFGPMPDNINGSGPDAVVSKTGLRHSAYCMAPRQRVHDRRSTTSTTCAFAANYVTGSHAFKVGMTDMWGTRNYQLRHQPVAGLDVLATASRRRSRNTRGRSIDLEHLKAALGIYAQDRWTIDRITLNLGLRFDYHNAYVPEQDAGGDLRLSPRAPLRPISNVPSWKDLSPRLGATYDLFGDGKTVARGSYRPLRGQRVHEHGDAQQPGEHLGQLSQPVVVRHQRQLRARLQPEQPRGTESDGVWRRQLRRARQPARVVEHCRRLRQVDHAGLRRPAERSGNRAGPPARNPAARLDRLPVHPSLVRQLRGQPGHPSTAERVRSVLRHAGHQLHDYERLRAAGARRRCAGS